MLNITDKNYEYAEKLLDTYYLEQLIELSNLSEIDVLAILLQTNSIDLPEVLPL
jgi:hypothetical protein